MGEETYVGDGDGLTNGGIAEIFEHVLDEQRALGDLLVYEGQKSGQSANLHSSHPRRGAVRATERKTGRQLLTNLDEVLVVALQLDLGGGGVGHDDCVDVGNVMCW